MLGLTAKLSRVAKKLAKAPLTLCAYAASDSSKVSADCPITLHTIPVSEQV